MPTLRAEAELSSDGSVMRDCDVNKKSRAALDGRDFISLMPHGVRLCNCRMSVSTYKIPFLSLAEIKIRIKVICAKSLHFVDYNPIGLFAGKIRENYELMQQKGLKSGDFNKN